MTGENLGATAGRNLGWNCLAFPHNSSIARVRLDVEKCRTNGVDSSRFKSKMSTDFSGAILWVLGEEQVWYHGWPSLGRPIKISLITDDRNRS